MSEPLKKTAGYAGIYAIGALLNRGIGFIMLPVYTRFLTPADYGVVELLALTVEVVSIVTGLGLMNGLHKFYYKYDSGHEVVAFSETEDYMHEEPEFEGLPVVPFETVQETHPPSEYRFHAPMSPQGVNRLREDIYGRVKAKGYEMISYVSSRATVFPGTPIGDNCFILEDNTIQPYTRIGNDVMIWSGNHIGHHSVIHDHVFITSHCVISGHCVVEPNCFLGVNCTLRDGITVARDCVIGAGALLLGNTKAKEVRMGHKAKLFPHPSDRLKRI